MQFTGPISKMISVFTSPIQYHLPVGNGRVYMNDLIGGQISLTWLGQIHCLNCGALTSKSFAQGYCYPCFISIPETEECVLNPEKCRAHEGVSRDMEYALENCLKDHIVYLALTNQVKVGVTRLSQIPTRWIDQGAWKAIKLAQTPNRYQAGIIEVALKNHLTDKTNWRDMLRNITDNTVSLAEEKKKISLLMPQDSIEFLSPDDTVLELNYPYTEVQQRITSMSFDKQPLVNGILIGIKGQYLIFKGGNVINIRKFGGYDVQLDY
jgi:hypothetical protein